ncbi:MAG: hypothetical protein H6623_01545 [Bdellovibrionaceae bacterium]|nr:hypothetical protein [Pseudobdellovibrionaceae bacterium]
MKKFITLLNILICYLSPSPAYPQILATWANEKAKTTYYYGHNQTKNLSTGQLLPEREIAFKKIVDPAQNQIVEFVCAAIGFEINSPYMILPLYMKIKGNNTTIGDKPDFTSKNIKGSGTLFGPSWRWEGSNIELQTFYGEKVRWVKDFNFESGDFLYSTKYIFSNEGTKETPKRKSEADFIMSLKVKKTTAKEFNAVVKRLGCDFTKIKSLSETSNNSK